MANLTLRLLLLLFTLLAWAQQPSGISENRKKELIEAIDNSSLDPRLLDHEEGAWCIEYIYNKRKEGVVVPWTNSDSLLALGDEGEIRRVMNSYPVYETGFNLIRMIGQPRLIEYMAPTMFINQTAEYNTDGDVFVLPSSTTAALQILQVASLSYELPNNVRFWAEDLYNRVDKLEKKEPLRSIMRDWWKENEQAVRKREWNAVKPGRRLETSNAVQLTSSEGLSSIKNPGVQAPQNTPQNPSGEQTLKPTEADSSSFWLWLFGGIAAVLAASIVIFGSRKKT